MVYYYACNGSEGQGQSRKNFREYVFDFTSKEEGIDEDMTFEGFKKQTGSLMDELDAFTSDLSELG